MVMHRMWVDGTNSAGARRLTSLRRNAGPEFRFGGLAPLAGTMDEASSQGDTVSLRQDAFQIVLPLLLAPSCGGYRADLGEKREPCEMVYDHYRKANER